MAQIMSARRFSSSHNSDNPLAQSVIYTTARSADRHDSLHSAAPTSRRWPRRTSPSSSMRSRGTPGWTRSCSRACGRTRSRLWSTNTSPWLPTQTGVRPQRCRFAGSRTQTLKVAVSSPPRRSDLSRGPFEFPDGARDDRRHAGQPGQVSGHEPASASLLHQVLSQHVPDR